MKMDDLGIPRILGTTQMWIELIEATQWWTVVIEPSKLRDKCDFEPNNQITNQPTNHVNIPKMLHIIETIHDIILYYICVEQNYSLVPIYTHDQTLYSDKATWWLIPVSRLQTAFEDVGAYPFKEQGLRPTKWDEPPSISEFSDRVELIWPYFVGQFHGQIEQLIYESATYDLYNIYVNYWVLLIDITSRI